ncbi:MAG: hypothetical protein HZB25_10105 [Candidatus Eisenbacteria bacterium]|nr:hypothetical protein [Candidatus Eisenbacteria bacterium]
MKARVFATAAAALVLVLGVRDAMAGQNAGATARMYWQVGTGQGDTARNSTAATVQLVVTVKGVKYVRGADVQLTVQGCSGFLPPAWQFQGGGCAEAAVDFRRGGFGGTNYPNLFTSGSAVPSLAQTQGGMYYQFAENPCIAPDSTATVWLSCAGAAGVARDCTREYAVLAFSLDLSGASTGGCQGDLADSSGPLGFLIAANHHIPCGFPPTGAYVVLVDTNAEKDCVPIEAGNDSLMWECAGSITPNLSAVSPIRLFPNQTA